MTVQQDPWVGELIAVLEDTFTMFVAAMTLPAAISELIAWLEDTREFVAAQYDDWQSVLDDFRDAYKESGPKLRREADRHYGLIEQRFTNLFTTSTSSCGDLQQSLDKDECRALLSNAQALKTALASDDSIAAAWTDLQKACRKPQSSAEDIEFKHKSLWAIAELRRQDTRPIVGLPSRLAAVMRGEGPSIAHEQQQIGSAQPQSTGTPPGEQESELPAWQRADLCEAVLRQHAQKADCIVWLRLDSAVPHQVEVTHGQVTFYHAPLLAECLGHPERVGDFTVIPAEVLGLDPQIQGDTNLAWASEPSIVYARVHLPDVEIHLARAQARTLVSALIEVKEPPRGSWTLHNEAILFADGGLLDYGGWGPTETHLWSQTASIDAVARRIELMGPESQTLDLTTTERLAAPLALASALTRAHEESAEATVMAAVRAIEHVNAWAIGGRSDWAAFVRKYFKPGASRAQLVEFLFAFTSCATRTVPDPEAAPPADLADIKEQLWTTSANVDYFKVNEALSHLSRLREIYQQHWLRRGLAELDSTFASGASVAGRLDAHGRRFDIHLKRLKRLRNAAIHGGPVTPDACESIAKFAHELGHYCLNQVMLAHLTGTYIRTHMDDFRNNERHRRESIETNSAYSELFEPNLI
ncbi:hypothetical protein AXA44_45220 [Rhodococcus sp. SC4]|nr:hypothetical protein AXA44_45220 [Rhodococcus sp. SC4]